jgi:hypothetical protein
MMYVMYVYVMYAQVLEANSNNVEMAIAFLLAVNQQ